ncbi:hypothetical protein FHX81_0556 [Saccharothrix saharensis]|uniref:Excreted virulence factor EspC (Type VII ESX diderm) n=1 Tax=Saccharothrix saharensis TaxID=571190 RepID=A0A543J628_9PSEU|nr:hypothetical protein [Saccharothrix saharensis]TQM78294.1 hypothetical protein FHX81_0556 [Saccharothrix saharensis]
MNANQGYRVELDLIANRITALTRLGDLTGDLATAVGRLAERQPKLGTAPPAVELATRLRAAAGESGLAGEVSAARREVEEFRQWVSAAGSSYTEADADVGTSVRAAGERPDGSTT